MSVSKYSFEGIHVTNGGVIFTTYSAMMVHVIPSKQFYDSLESTETRSVSYGVKPEASGEYSPTSIKAALHIIHIEDHGPGHSSVQHAV